MTAVVGFAVVGTDSTDPVEPSVEQRPAYLMIQDEIDAALAERNAVADLTVQRQSAPRITSEVALVEALDSESIVQSRSRYRRPRRGQANAVGRFNPRSGARMSDAVEIAVATENMYCHWVGMTHETANVAGDERAETEVEDR